MNSLPREEAIRIAQERIAQKPVYLDTETTGVTKNDVLVEIAVIDHDGTALVDTLAKPFKPIHPDAFNVHRITSEMVVDVPRWSEVWPEVEAALSGRVVAIFNADFDLRIMKQSHTHNQMRWRKPEGTTFFDVMALYAQFYGQWNPRYRNYRWQSLEKARAQCGLTQPNTHRALDDTLLTRAVLHYMAEREE